MLKAMVFCSVPSQKTYFFFKYAAQLANLLVIEAIYKHIFPQTFAWTSQQPSFKEMYQKAYSSEKNINGLVYCN